MAIATVIVLYRPDSDTLAFVEAYASASNPVVAVWNEYASNYGEWFQNNQAVVLIKSPHNMGLAKALNVGIGRAFDDGASSVFLLDQDSRPDVRLPHALMACRDRAAAAGIAVALIGPTLKDRKAGGAVNPASRANTPFQIVRRLSTSGSLIDKQAFEQVGPMWEPLFIDGIDHEWCYRARDRGFSIVQSLTVEMEHDMGDAGINFFGQYKPIHRSPIRHYHIVRNGIWLTRLPHVPKSFSLVELMKMAYRVPAYVLVSASALRSVSAIFRGLRDGLLSTPENLRM